MKEGILSHHEVMHRLDIIEMERGECLSSRIQYTLQVLIPLRVAYRRQGCWSPWILPHWRWCRPQPSYDFLRSRLPSNKGIQEGSASILHEQGCDGKDCSTRGIRRSSLQGESILDLSRFYSMLRSPPLSHSLRDRTKTPRSTLSLPPNNPSLLFTPTNGSINPTSNYLSNTQVTRLVSEKKLDLLDETFSVSSEFINSKRSNK